MSQVENSMSVFENQSKKNSSASDTIHVDESPRPVMAVAPVSGETIEVPSASKGNFFDGSRVKANVDHSAFQYIMFMFPGFDPDRECVAVTQQSKNGSWLTCSTGDPAFKLWTRKDSAAAWYVCVLPPYN